MLFQGAPLLMLLLLNQTEEIAKATLSWSTAWFLLLSRDTKKSMHSYSKRYDSVRPVEMIQKHTNFKTSNFFVFFLKTRTVNVLLFLSSLQLIQKHI